MALHFNDALDLTEVDIFSVSFRNNFVKSAEKLECIPQYLSLIARSARVSNDTSKEMK